MSGNWYSYTPIPQRFTCLDPQGSAAAPKTAPPAKAAVTQTSGSGGMGLSLLRALLPLFVVLVAVYVAFGRG